MALRKALIFRPHNTFAVNSFVPTVGEMTSIDLLKMLDKRIFHGSAAYRPPTGRLEDLQYDSVFCSRREPAIGRFFLRRSHR